MAYYVYIMTNSLSTVLYTGVTNDLERRVYEHKWKLVYFEDANDIQDAIAREKQIKGWRRSRKVELVETMNSDWRDLSADWYT